MSDQIEGKVDGVPHRYNPKSWHPILSIVLGSILGSGGSLGVIYATPVGQQLTRPNPYTSIDAQIYQAKTNARLGALELHIGEAHPDRRQDFDARINENKFQIGMITITMNTIGSAVNKNSEKLDKLLERK